MLTQEQWISGILVKRFFLSYQDQISSVSQCSQSLRSPLAWRTSQFLTRSSSMCFLTKCEIFLIHEIIRWQIRHSLHHYCTIIGNYSFHHLYFFFICASLSLYDVASTNPTTCSVFTIPDLWGKDLWTQTTSLLWVTQSDYMYIWTMSIHKFTVLSFSHFYSFYFSPCGSNAQPSPLCISCLGSCAGLKPPTWNMWVCEAGFYCEGCLSPACVIHPTVLLLFSRPRCPHWKMR